VLTHLNYFSYSRRSVVIQSHRIVFDTRRQLTTIALFFIASTFLFPLILWAMSFVIRGTRNISAMAVIGSICIVFFGVALFIAVALIGGKVRLSQQTFLFVPRFGKPRWIYLADTEAMRWSVRLHLQTHTRWYTFPMLSTSGKKDVVANEIRLKTKQWLNVHFDLTDILPPEPCWTLRLYHMWMVGWPVVVMCLGCLAAWRLMVWYIRHTLLPFSVLVIVIVTAGPMMQLAMFLISQYRHKHSPYSMARLRLHRRIHAGFEPIVRDI
jgi:hypothetical protein